MQQTLVLDQELIGRYDQSGPRYTSYPTAVQFHDGFGPDEYRAAARASNAGGQPLSLYFHIPFCDTVCFYCACNKIATKDRTRAQPYLDRVYREIALQAELFDSQRPVEQLHWGGGTPTHLTPEQVTYAALDTEFSCEIYQRGTWVPGLRRTIARRIVAATWQNWFSHYDREG